MKAKAAAGVVCLAALAMEPASARAQGPPAEQNQPPVIRTGVAEVVLDVVVRDRRGRLVRNLKPEDLEIYENGVRQQIRSFRLAGVESRRTERSQSKPAPGPAAFGGQRPMPLRAVNLLCFVFHNLDPVNRTRALRLAESVLSEELPPNTLAAVFTLDDYLTPVSAFTDQRKDLLAAVQQAFSGRALDFDQASVAVLSANPNTFTVEVLVSMAGSATTATVTDRVTGGEVSKIVVPRAEVAMAPGANALRGDRARERVDMAHVSGRRALDQIEVMVSQLSKLPGRKSVVLISGGLLTTGDPDAFGRLVAKANAANITVYSFDPTELDETTDTQAAKIALSQVAAVSRTQGSLNPSLQERRQQSRQGDALEVAVRSSDLRAALRELAEGTGGFLVANTSEFRKPFQRVLDQMEAHYEVAYRPAELRLDGRLRTIEVKPARKDLIVESRTGYFALPPKPDGAALAPHEVIGLAVLGREPQPKDLDFQTGFYAFGGDGARREVALAFEVPGKILEVAQDAARGIAQAHLSLVGLVKDASGEVVEQFSVDAPYQFALGNLAAMQASRITEAQSLRLAPGHYTVEVALMDRAGGRTGVKTLDLEVPAAPQGLVVSTPVLVQQVKDAVGAGRDDDPLVYQGRRVVPLVTPTLEGVTQPHVYFVVYPEKNRPEKAQLQVEFFVNGQRLAAQT
ncbi:MAG: VWA domain-containing protein, partial [Bryobacteraceae bacterium]